MSIDIAYLIIIALAAMKGFSRGLIMAVFSFAALFIGLAAALKLSSVVANYFKSSDALPSHWWPVIAFAAVFLIAVFIVKAAGGIVEKTVQLALLGWVNRIGGFLVYAVLYTLLFSVLLFFLTQMNLVTPEVKGKSVTYAYIEPWGPWTIAGLGKVIPAFKDVFGDLQEFFEQAGTKLKA
jgi:membrane protein required for colicin V production